MNPVTHLLLSWPVANAGRFNKRRRAAITLAGISPDVDAFGIIADWVTRASASPLHWWDRFHHVLGHNLAFGLTVAGAAFWLSGRRASVAVLALLTFHLHLLCDLMGARGPDGYSWPIVYLYPFSHTWRWVWQGQWAINAWPNFAITAAALFLTLYLAWRRGFSPLEMLSVKIDAALVEALRKRFGPPGPS